MILSLSDIRKFLLHNQGLDGTWELPKGKEGAYRVIESLGYVQIDTISVVQRAHHHTIWSRFGEYRPEMLDDLQRNDRKVFEYWDHGASIIPMANYRYYISAMNGFASPSAKTRVFLDANRKLTDLVLSRITEEGALGSSDFERPEGRKRAGWWDWKPAKRALEELFNAGRLMVSHRVNFERKYDLPERVIPSGIDTSPPSPEADALFRINRILHATGFIPEYDLSILNHGGIDRGTAGELISSDVLVPFHIEGFETEPPLYGLREVIDAIHSQCRHPAENINILSPFDNCIVNRHQTRRLFRFDYKLEAYFPEKKRQYGYFCLPILWGDRFAGRMDSKALREEGTFTIINLYFEKSRRDFGDCIKQLAKRMSEFVSFNNCRRIQIVKTSPTKYRGTLSRLLKQTTTSKAGIL